MKVIINDKVEELKGSISVSTLLKLKDIPSKGTAVAINNVIIPATRRDEIMINNNDNIIIVSAAYGG